MTDKEYVRLYFLIDRKELTAKDIQVLDWHLSHDDEIWGECDWNEIITWLEGLPDIPLKVRARMKAEDYQSQSLGYAVPPAPPTTAGVPSPTPSLCMCWHCQRSRATSQNY
jgi:hypothetical protein